MATPTDTIVALMGPTASGKTQLALRLADIADVDIISVDSAMVYKGMDIGTAKPPAAVLQRYPHGLIDIRDPVQSYSAAEFVSDARACVAAALAAGRLPLLVGGTMLYFKAFKHGLANMPQVSAELRAQLAARAMREGLAALHAELAKVDPVAAERIHPNNPQRLLRALEVYASSGTPISHYWQQQTQRGVADELGCALVELSIEPARASIHAAIEKRFTAMLEAGFIDEVRKMRARGDLSVESPAMRAVGYRQVWRHLAGESDRAAMVAQAVAATRQLAKRQFTWLKRWQEKIVLDAVEQANPAAILQSIEGASIVRRTFKNRRPRA